MAPLFGQELFQFVAIFEVGRNVNDRRNVGLLQIDLLQQRCEEFGCLEIGLIFPEELAAVDDLAVAEVEQIDRDQRRLGVVGEDVDVLAFRRRDLLFLLHLFDGSDQVAQAGGLLEAHLERRLLHALAQFVGQIAQTAFQEQPDVANGAGVGFVRGQTLHAWTQTAVNVILQAGMRVVAVEIHFAGRHQEMAVNEVDQPVRQIAGEVRAVISGTVLAQPAGHVHARILLTGELDVRVSLVVAQQDVEARLVALDEIVLKRQRFLVVVDRDVVDVARFGDQRAGLGIGQALVGEVAAHAGAQVLRLADIDDGVVLIFVEVDARKQG